MAFGLGAYREANVATGLPLPRTGLRALTILIAVVAGVAVAMPVLLLVAFGGSLRQGVTLFRQGGWSMWGILAVELIAPIAIATLGAFIVRGRGVAPGLVFAGAVLPFVVALAGGWGGYRMTVGALRGGALDPALTVRILAVGFAESMTNDVFGGLVACGCGITATIAAASAAMSIDITNASRGGDRPSSLGAVGVAICGATWFAATLVVGVLRTRHAGWLVFVPLLPIAILVPVAVFAARGAAVLRNWHDSLEASRVAGALLVAAVCATFAMLVLQRCIESRFMANTLMSFADANADARYESLIDGIQTGHLASTSHTVHVLGAATFVFALAPALGPRILPSPSALAAVVIAVGLFAGTMALGRARASAPQSFTNVASAAIPRELNVPIVPDAFANIRDGVAAGVRLVVPANATAIAVPSDGTPNHYAIYADRAAPLANIQAAMGSNVGTEVSFVTIREHPRDIETGLGPFAGWIAPVAYVGATFGYRRGGRFANHTMRVVVTDDDVLIDGRRCSLPIPESAAPILPTDEIRYVFRPTDSVERLVRTIVSVETTFQRQLESQLRRTILFDDIEEGLPR